MTTTVLSLFAFTLYKEGVTISKSSNFNTEYDDVFRTLLNDLPQYAIPLINEFFGTSYSMTDEVHLGNNELFIIEPDLASRKRITDSSIYINDNSHHRFHIECQSTEDDEMLIRMYDYDSQIALRSSSTLGENLLTVNFPDSGILYLRSSDKTPSVQKIKIVAGQQSIIHEVHIVKMSDYTLDDIFKKGLLILLPFYIFNLERCFTHSNKNADYMDIIQSDFMNMYSRLQHLMNKHQISEYMKYHLTELINKVVKQIAAKHDDVKKGVSDIMGGRVIETEASRIYKSGVLLGHMQGEDRINDLYDKLFEAGRDDDVRRATKDKVFKQKLFEEFNIV